MPAPPSSLLHDGQHLAGGDLRAGLTPISVTVPAYGALTVCCIFIASSTSTGWPAATSAPTSTATLTTVPGIGASSEPLATASAGSVNRGTRVSRTCPRGRVHVGDRAAGAQDHAVRRALRPAPQPDPVRALGHDLGVVLGQPDAVAATPPGDLVLRPGAVPGDERRLAGHVAPPGRDAALHGAPGRGVARPRRTSRRQRRSGVVRRGGGRPVDQEVRC